MNVLQTDWFDFFFRVPIHRKFVSNKQYLQTVDELTKAGVRIMIVEVVAGGYLITTKKLD